MFGHALSRGRLGRHARLHLFLGPGLVVSQPGSFGFSVDASDRSSSKGPLRQPRRDAHAPARAQHPTRYDGCVASWPAWRSLSAAGSSVSNFYVFTPLIVPLYGLAWTRAANAFLVRCQVKLAARAIRCEENRSWS